MRPDPAGLMIEPMHTLEELQFQNTYRRLPDAFYTPVAPTPLANPYLISVNPDAAALIGLDPKQMQRRDFVDYFSGKRALPGYEPLAMCYSGHQFGHYVPRLGDGRAILLGEVRGARTDKWDLHLKGAGLTPYSRQGDGRAVLRSTIREYLCGEAMHGLGIPTSRSLCIIGSDEEVHREKIETGAMLVRLAPSHVRFGTFEYFYYTNQFDHLRTLAEYVINQHYPWLVDAPKPALALFNEVVARTARLIAQWQVVGFAHGVMNTDNMSMLGITLDYGPFGFLEHYEPGFICNHSDHQGRYAFDRQPDIGLFNLSCLAQAMLPLLSDVPEEAVDQAKAVLALYQPALVEHYAQGMRAKLGLQQTMDEDQKLVADLLEILAINQVDYTRFFRALAGFAHPSIDGNAPLRDMFRDRTAYDAWADRYARRLDMEHSDTADRRQRMNHSNPKYILRNYLAEAAIRRAQEERDYSEITQLRELLSKPCEEQPGKERYAAEPPDWARHIEVSCSS